MSSDNKYGLDFRVWGYDKTEKKKDPTPDILKSIGHGWGESSKPKKQEEVVEYTEERIEPKKELITCVLKNARFLPDENTDFGKPCKIRLEIEGESHRLVHLYLWAVYNGEEHDLRHEVEANHNQGICETEMPLFYVEPYHNDVFKNGKKDAKVEYFAKIKMHGAKEIRSELMVMPRPPAILNINEIDGPCSLAHDTKSVYVVKSFNREASQEEKDSLSWAVKINSKEIERFENVGEIFEYTPCAKYAGETITVHPFLRSPSDNLFIKTTIGQYLLYNGSELIWLDESHKEVGKWKACSSSDNADPAKENGPLPEGNWVILQDARDQNPNDNWWKDLTGKNEAVIWTDKNRVELIPFKETDTHGRLEKFYVFGGEDSNSSLHGINLAGDINDFVDKFQKSGKNLVLLVKHVDLNINNDVLYGGFILKIGDNDKENIWGGKISKENGTFIADLQKDLVTLGYWISDADLTNGMLCNGIIDIKTKGAITTFQRENNILETGILDLTTSNKINECLSNPNWKRPANRTEKYGDFFQLPPSPYYKRYFPTYDTNGVIIDNWGTKSTINMILNCASKWSLKGMEYFLVGDISLYNGGEFRPHSSHRDGNSVDIDSSIYCSIDKPTFNKQTSLALAKLFVQYGAKRILFNCKYVIDNCNQVFSCIGHHNHFHIDCKDIQGTNQEKYECSKCALYSTCDYQNKR